jgi:hypothetical protein
LQVPNLLFSLLSFGTYKGKNTARMNLRQKLQTILLLFLILVTFASYHQGSTAWLQWLTVVSLLFFAFVFDLLFTSDAHFIFDPDAENWRRKTVRVLSVTRRSFAPEVARGEHGLTHASRFDTLLLFDDTGSCQALTIHEYPP